MTPPSSYIQIFQLMILTVKRLNVPSNAALFICCSIVVNLAGVMLSINLYTNIRPRFLCANPHLQMFATAIFTQKLCEACSGRGVVVYKDGVEVQEPETTSRHSATNSSDRDSSQAQDQGPNTSNSMSDEQAQALRDEVLRMSDKLQQYEKVGYQNLLNAECSTCMCISILKVVACRPDGQM